MTQKIIIAGAGGQGIMLLGKITAQSGMHAGLHTTWLPAYGAEVRGGAAYCMVILSDEPIGNPYIDRADVFIALNETGFQKFRHRIDPNGTWILNSSLVSSLAPPTAASHAVPFTDEALALGNVRVANIIALGTYVAVKDGLTVEQAAGVIREYGSAVSKPLLELNLKALQTGVSLARRVPKQRARKRGQS